jgi:cation diffusion facilitator CzcD-associated flavoprotein CzcO
MKTVNVNEQENWDTIIIGAGQAGLAAGYHLLKAREDFIVATGTNPLPRIPIFAKDLDKNIHQIHSSQYLNPDSLPLVAFL